MKNKITGALITGGAGFIGSNLARELLLKGIPVVAVDDFTSAWAPNADELLNLKASAPFQLIRADIIEPWENWRFHISENIRPHISHVFHLASPASPRDFDRLGDRILWANSIGLDRALKFATEIRARVIFSSTSEVYGSLPETEFHENHPGLVDSFGPRSAYDEGKRFGEALLRDFNLRYQTNHGLVRIFNTYGPRMHPHDGRVITEFLTCAIQGLPIPLEGNGEQSRSFCFIGDLIPQLLAYAESDLTTPVNIGNDEEVSIASIIPIIRALGFENLKIHQVPRKPADPSHRRPNLKMIRTLLPENFKPSGLHLGLGQTLDWLISQSQVSFQVETLSP